MNTPEELRSTLTRWFDWVLDEMPGHRLLTDDERKLLKAQRDFWAGDDGSQLTRLLAFLEREP